MQKRWLCWARMSKVRVYTAITVTYWSHMWISLSHVIISLDENRSLGVEIALLKEDWFGSSRLYIDVLLHNIL
jgi:hypothetical protein